MPMFVQSRQIAELEHQEPAEGDGGAETSIKRRQKEVNRYGY
jgi:hypothetical protein